MNIEFQKLIERAYQIGASDVHLSPDHEPVFRVAGQLQHWSECGVIPADSIASWLSEWAEIAGVGSEGWLVDRQYDFALDVNLVVGRVRMTVFHSVHGTSLAIRLLSLAPPSPQAVQMPQFLRDISAFSQGLILVTGPTGSGKSTTLASWIADRLTKEPAHIITVEDPIEYVFEHGVGLVNQCEVGQHFSTFSEALSGILRRDPDVIMAGELRDLDSVRLALRAAETGHLVLATLHSSSASDAVSRLINVFPADSEQFVRHVVSNVLLGVVAQRLVRSDSPNARQGRVANYEVLTATPAVRHLIKDQKEAQLAANMQTGAANQMFTFAQHWTVLQQMGLVH